MLDFLFLFDRFLLGINKQNIIRKKEEKFVRVSVASVENWRSEVEKGKRFEALHGGNKTGILYSYCHRSRKFGSRSKGLKAPKNLQAQRRFLIKRKTSILIHFYCIS
uniref:Ovule protein n=1 Tax=Romanomermis culicivorax TaxID=13658 RepID=A0A915IAV4_ROMCU